MTVGVRHDDLRRKNRAMVIASARRGGQPSRTEIAAATGLSNSTISTISADLISEGILTVAQAGEAGAMKRGRPQVALALDPRAASVVTISLSLNFLSAALIDYSGRVVIERSSRPRTMTMSEAELFSAVRAAIADVIGEVYNSVGPLMRMTMAIQGITDSAKRTLLWSPITPHSDVPFADLLEQEFAIPVTVENDCNMIAAALRVRSPERYSENLIAVMLSHGIGMGLVLRGELFTGTHSSGGEFGHMNHVPDGAQCRCGRRGCVEAYAGNYAIYRHARGESPLAEPVSDIDTAEMHALANAARAHDGPEREAFQQAGEALGFALGSLFALFDPAPVAFVGLGTSAFDIIEPSMRDAIARTAGGQHNAAISFDVEPDEAPLIRAGCASQALTHIDQEVFAPGAITTPAPSAKRKKPVALAAQ
jgi:predicted NBD/HSP70 family sugar kinase